MQRGPSRRNSFTPALQEFLAVRSVFALLLTGLLTSLMTATFVSGNEFVGKVRNGTTRRFARGDEVVLLSVSEHGIEEIERCRTDAAGSFRFKQISAGEVYRVRVIHDGVAYEQTAELRAGNIPVVEVFDVAGKLDGATAIMDVQRLEATNETLEVKQLVTVRNESKPPRTLMIDHSFEFQLPAEAQVKSGLVQIESENPSREKPLSGDREGLYYFRVPLRPGDTRFGVVYQLPYKGKAEIEPHIRNSNERFVVMLPKSMGFEPRVAGVFASMADVSLDNVQGTAPVRSDQTLAFAVSGTGVLEELQERRAQRNGDSQQKVLSPELMHMVVHQGSVPNSPGMTKPAHNQDTVALFGLTAFFAAGTASIYFARRRTATPVVAQRPAIPTVNQRASRSKRHAHGA